MASRCPFCNAPTIKIGKSDICTNIFCEMPMAQSNTLLASMKGTKGIRFPKNDGTPPKTNRHKGEPRHFVNHQNDTEFRIFHRPKHARFYSIPTGRPLLWGFIVDEITFVRAMEKQGYIECF